MLPDLLAAGLRLVIVGTAVGTASAARGHYYAGSGNEFWPLLHQSGLVPALLTPEQDRDVLAHGIGLTDLAKNIAQSHDRGLRAYYDVPGFLAKMEQYQPRWVALHGKSEAAKTVARHLGQPKPGLGRMPWTVGLSQVFVLPSASGANRRPNYEGRPTRLEWWRELAQAVSG